jgi:hypothetical protein
MMSTVKEIKAAIDRLSTAERSELERLLYGAAEDDRDRQMKTDAEAGRFDRVLKEVDRKIDAGNQRDMP